MSSSFINGLAEHIRTHYDLQKEELTVVFPNKRAAFYLRSRFKEICHDDIWLPQMCSIQEAMTQWSGLRLIDKLDMMFELIAIDAERRGQTHLDVFGGMATQMADDFDEIDQYNVDATHLFSYIEAEKRLGVWHPDQQTTPKEAQYLQFFAELIVYYERLRERLLQQGKGYYGMITRALANLPAEALLEKTGRRTFLFAGFNALTPTEQKIIDTLYRSGQAEVVWDFDRYYVEDPQNEAGYFAQRYLRQNIPWKPTVFSDQLLHDHKEIHLVGVNGKTIQTKALQSLLEAEHEVNPAVILADENLIIPVLNSIPDVERYPVVKVSMGYPMRQTALYHFIQTFFTLQRKGSQTRDGEWHLWPLLRLLDQELVKVVFTPEENHQIDQYRRQVDALSLFRFKREDFDACCSSEDLRRFVRLLLSGDETGHPAQTDATSPTRLLETLAALLVFLSQKIQQDDAHDKRFLLNQVSEAGKAVNRLRDIAMRHRDYVQSLEDLETLFRLVVNQLTIKLNNSTTDGLQVMGLLEARNLDFDTFYMVGVNEGVLPADNHAGSFIPHSIRKECHLPDYQEKQAVFAYHFYRQLQGASRVYYLYNTQGSSNGGEPSRFLMQLQYELAARNPNIQLFNEVFDHPTEKQPLPERLVLHKDAATLARMNQKIRTDDPHYALAPTSLSAFIQCPLRFYLRYVLRIKDNAVEEETQRNVIGTVIHKTLELLYQDRLNTVIDKALFETAIKPSVLRVKEQAIASSFSQGLPDTGYNYLDRLAIDRFIDNYVGFEAARLSAHPLNVLHLEKLLHTTLHINGTDYLLAGTADRIDRYDGLTRIVDYKTGHVETKDVTVPKTLADLASGMEQAQAIPEKAMQLLIYKYLYLKEHPEVSAKDVTASLFALRYQQVRFDLIINYEPLNEDFMGTMERLLTAVLSNMTDTTIPFNQPDACNACRYCDFQRICANTATGA
ncbi:MAG: PD-(D/E)XK nuclease family protein [Bacteroidales bacterium]|nr:PD-(D/E)XK nuclease family protein [Bacteroidales bacterium]